MDLTNKSIEELRAIKSAEICELKKELKEIINKKSYNEVEAPIKSENNGKTTGKRHESPKNFLIYNV